MARRKELFDDSPKVEVSVNAAQFSAQFVCYQHEAHRIIRKLRLSRLTRKKVSTLVTIRAVSSNG